MPPDTAPIVQVFSRDYDVVTFRPLPLMAGAIALEITRTENGSTVSLDLDYSECEALIDALRIAQEKSYAME